MSLNNSHNLILAGSLPDQNLTNIIKIFDLRKIENTPAEVKSYESPLKYETSSICPVNEDAFLIGSIEGKIAMEFLNDVSTGSSSKQNYSFKCHREETDTSLLVYSVNTLVYLKMYVIIIIYLFRHNIFLSGGSDKFIYGWDNKKRKKMYKSQPYPNAVSKISVNSNGSLIAVASSYLYEDGNFEIDLNNVGSIGSISSMHKIYLANLDDILNVQKN
jgi:cell cycle arrest protein BUB3